MIAEPPKSVLAKEVSQATAGRLLAGALSREARSRWKCPVLPSAVYLSL